MTRTQLPQPRAVLMAHVRAIAFALRVPLLIAPVFAIVATIFLAIQIANGDMTGNLYAEPSALPSIIGALLAIAVWVREERFGPGFLWTLPVDRSRHALIKVLAGWLWLMAGVALFALSVMVLALVYDGGVLPVRSLQVLIAPVTSQEPLDPAALRTEQWAPGPLIVLVPFVSATATYLLASAFMVGVRHPLRWIVGAVVTFPVASAISHVGSRMLGMLWMTHLPERAVTGLLEGRYGLEALVTLRTWSLDRRMHLTSGERIHVWSAVPDLGDWRIAALLWTGAGALAVWFAASRHRERRRERRRA
ncbi:MAG TPA: hypothetical protein VE869_13820 [Gemmatimonas sp.]|nr:hypothetical protein [Gemmatimonas sp.]